MLLGVPAALFLCFWAARAGDPGVASRVAGIAQTERTLPWFWSPSAEGLTDVPYTYEGQISRRILSRGGKELPPKSQTDGIATWHNVRLERIPLEFGAFLRCLSQDGVTPCSKEWDEELKRQVKQRDELSPEARARIEQTREERRVRRRAFWDRFPAAMEFDLAGADQIRFSPRTKGGQALLDAMKGRLWFDAATNEITQMEYELMRDVDDVLLKRPKGTRFRIELTKAGDEHYLPLRISSQQGRGKSGEIEETTAEFANFRRFASESGIKFGDLPAEK